MSKYIEVESLKKDIKEALKDKSEFMADAVCNVIDRRKAKEPMQSNTVCKYCLYEKNKPNEPCRNWDCGLFNGFSHFTGKKVIEVEE